MTLIAGAIRAPLAPRSKPAALPEIEAPSLAGLKVTVLEPAPLTQEELEGRLAFELLAIAKRTPRHSGEEPKRGDEIEWDCIGYSRGALVPFIARYHERSRLEPWPHFPGMAEALEHVTVGGAAHVQLTLSPEHPVKAFQGQSARLLVELHRAVAVELPDPQAKSTLKKIDKGPTLAAVFDRLAAEAMDDRRAQAWVQARGDVMRALAERTKWQPPRALVDEEIWRRWYVAEGAVLSLLGVEVGDQRRSRAYWLESPDIRATAERSLVIAAAARALIRERAVPPPPKGSDSLAFVLDSILPRATVNV